MDRNEETTFNQVFQLPNENDFPQIRRIERNQPQVQLNPQQQRVRRNNPRFIEPLVFGFLPDFQNVENQVESLFQGAGIFFNE